MRKALRLAVSPVLALAALAVFGAGPARAQLPNAAAPALGMAQNFTAAARGYQAVSWNPANLGLPDNPGFSFSLLPLRGEGGLGPVSLADLKPYSSKIVPATVRQTWLQQIQQQGAETGNVGADITFLALQAANVGLQLSSTIQGTTDLAAPAAALALFGNVGPNGQAANYDLAGSGLNFSAVTTAALSYGESIPVAHLLGFSGLSVGATVKYSVGQVLVYGQDQGSTVTASPLALNVAFPVVMNDTSNFTNNGTGVGLDVGAALQRPGWTVGVVVKNLVNTFRWDQAKLRYRPLTAVFNQDSSSAAFVEKPLSQAPAALRNQVASLTFRPVLALGAAFQPNAKTTLTMDMRRRFGNGLSTEPATHAGVGIEYRALAFLPVRAGFALVTGGTEYSGGLGLRLGPFSMDASVLFRSTPGGGTDQLGMVELVSVLP